MADLPRVESVRRQRYEEIVAELREAVQQESRACWLVGDRALEIEPMRPRGGSQTVLPGEVLLSVRESLFMLAEDIGLKYRTVETRRWAASRWPSERRRLDLSYTIHRTLAHIEDEQERFAAIHTPPGASGHGPARMDAGPGESAGGVPGGQARLAAGEDQRDPYPGQG